MPYGMYYSSDTIYLVLLIPVLLLSLYAQSQVSGRFSHYSKVTNRRGLTGAQAAAAVLRAHGVTDVGIARCSGNLTDHYDPRDNTIYLSENVFDTPTVAAVGVAAHEAGHAVQYAENYGPVKLRKAGESDVDQILEMLQGSAMEQGFPDELAVTAEDLRQDGFGADLVPPAKRAGPDERAGRVRGRRHQHLSGQEEADPVWFPRGGAGGVRDQGISRAWQESALAVHNDQPAHAQAPGCVG